MRWKEEEALLRNSKNPGLAWQLYKRLINSSSNSVILRTLPIITNILITSGNLPEIKHLHALLLHKPNPKPSYTLIRLLTGKHLQLSISLLNSTISHYHHRPPPTSLYNFLLSNTQSLHCALNLFDKIPSPNPQTLSLLARAYSRAGLPHLATPLLDSLPTPHPNTLIFNTLISSFLKLGQPSEAERIVTQMTQIHGILPDVVTFNSRISSLALSGHLSQASIIFRDMLSHQLPLPSPNAVTFNIMLRGLCNHGMLCEAEPLFQSIRSSGTIRIQSYNIWLHGLARSGDLSHARSVLKEMDHNAIEPDVYSYNALVHGLCRNGLTSEARDVIRLMTNGGSVMPDTVTYSTLLHGYCSRGNVLEANNLLREMLMRGCFPNTYTCNILLHSLWREGRVSEAEKLLEKMNERGHELDVITCNIMIDGLCKSGKLDKAIEILNGMCIHGNAALGDLGNSYIGLVDNRDPKIKCVPDLITYSTVIHGLCSQGRFDEAKAIFVELTAKKLSPDSAVYNIFISSFCKYGKVSSALRVLKDMERNGYGKTLQTYNSLIMGLGRRNQLSEMYELLNEMREKDIRPDDSTYNNLIASMCECGKLKDAASLLDEMMHNSIPPNMSSFKILIESSCKAREFRAAREFFEISQSICGHTEPLHSTVFNQMLFGGETSEATKLLIAAMDRCYDLKNFSYKDLVNKLCDDDKLEEANGILNAMIEKGCKFDPVSFTSLIECVSKRKSKYAANEVSEKVMLNKNYRNERLSILKKRDKLGENNHWRTILHRDDGSGIALKSLKRVRKGWGQGKITSLQPQNNNYLDLWEGNV